MLVFCTKYFSESFRCSKFATESINTCITMYTIKTKSVSLMAFALCSVVVFTSCKSSESAYKKAYEKAQAQAAQQEQATTTTTTAPVQEVQIAPVTTPQTPATDVSNEPVRSENVPLISGAGLKNFSVVCGSFSLKANAEGLQQTLKGKGYASQIVYNPSIKFYRVVASTSDDKAAAVQSRNVLRSTYPDAWILFKGQ